MVQSERSRVASIVIGAAMILTLAGVIVRGRRRAPPAVLPAVAPDVVASGTPADRLERAMSDLEKLPPLENEGVGKILAALDGVRRSSVGFKLPDGSDPPPLPNDAPRVVRFGVVLVKYHGAQLASDDALTREAALERAHTLARLAKEDFAAAVRGGDKGSREDVGTLQRGVLEPGTEYVLFTLPVGWTSEVLDTPRGFWIVRRMK